MWDTGARGWVERLKIGIFRNFEAVLVLLLVASLSTVLAERMAMPPHCS